MHPIRILVFFAAINFYTGARAQNVETDSLKKELVVQKDEKKRVSILEGLSYAYLSSSPDTALQYALQGLQLAQRIKYPQGVAICTNAIGNVYFHTGDNAKALEMYLSYLKMKENLKDLHNLSVAYFNIASVYTEEKDYTHALYYLFKTRAEDEKAKDTSAILYDDYSLGSVYLRMQKIDSALYYTNHSYQFAIYLDDKNMIGAVLNNFGEIYLASNDTTKAEKYYKLSLPYAEAISDYEVLASDHYGLARIYKGKGMLDSSIHYASEAFYIAENAPFFKNALETSSFLSGLFKIKKQYDSAFHYQELSIAIKDSLFNVEQLKKVQDLKFQEQQRQQSIETEKIKFQNTIKLFVAIAVAVIILIIAIVLWRNNKEKQKANLLLTEQKNKVESTLSELGSTQAQLIQSEKMASLGELTAGIAHEIQNPLNFINNFSDVNKELVNELREEIKKGNIEEINAIAGDIEANEEKINHHGKRADAIVKAMLQHSRANSGQKELTDINALTDEYLRLSYHGMRAKDKAFNAEIKTDFEESIGKVNVVPQDVGRVILNLINNAFYAVKERQKAEGAGYEPRVTVSTKKIGVGISIKVTDNGNGMPENLVDKIFQPFFTTKPTGQGTGLGLSLSYDIVKAHGGAIKVKTQENEGTEFTIILPA